MREHWHSELLQRFHLVIYLMLIIASLRYVFLYGDVQTSFPRILFLLAILEGLVYEEKHHAAVARTELPASKEAGPQAWRALPASDPSSVQKIPTTAAW